MFFFNMKIENKVYSAKTAPYPNSNLQMNKTGGKHIRHFTAGVLFIMQDLSKCDPIKKLIQFTKIYKTNHSEVLILLKYDTFMYTLINI